MYVVDTIAANRFVIFFVSEGDYTLDDSFWNEETSVGKLKRNGERGFSNVSQQPNYATAYRRTTILRRAYGITRPSVCRATGTEKESTGTQSYETIA